MKSGAEKVAGLTENIPFQRPSNYGKNAFKKILAAHDDTIMSITSIEENEVVELEIMVDKKEAVCTIEQAEFHTAMNKLLMDNVYLALKL